MFYSKLTKIMNYYGILVAFLMGIAFVQQLVHANIDIMANEKAKPSLVYTLPNLTVQGQEIANSRSFTTYESLSSNLGFNPRIDFQSRNISEAQGDVNIRGGIFEGTGFQIGGLTIIDPQTGHYSSELPISPKMLDGPKLYTGADNSLYGFNSTSGTLKYDWKRIIDGGSATLGWGDNALNFQGLNNAWTNVLDEDGYWAIGFEFDISNSEGDGTIENGDHVFKRRCSRIQLLNQNSQTDLFFGKQNKFFGWPQMYTQSKRDVSIEYEDLETEITSINHYRTYGFNNYFEITASYRTNLDFYNLDGYNLDGSNQADYSVNHSTKFRALGFNGLHNISDNSGILYSGVIASDNWKKFNEMYNGGGPWKGNDSTKYYKLTILPKYKIINSNGAFSMRLGGSVDTTNRVGDNRELSLISDLSWERLLSNGDYRNFNISYAESSQVTGYTAIGEGGKGPFKSDVDLGRETSKILELGYSFKQNDLKFEGAIFYRWDDDLIDWVYELGDPYDKSAAAVDIETFGLELFASKQWKSFQVISSYTFLEKKDGFFNENLAGSYYALNYAKHRFTLAAIILLGDNFKLSVDNEWRRQQKNSLRNGPEKAIFTNINLSFFPDNNENLEFFFAVDNAWDEEFEDLPRMPGKGVQFTLGSTLLW